MNQELEIKLQAYMDGELSERESRQVEEWVAQDKEATRMLNELAWTRSFLVEHEPAPVVPESREFYWSKIEREIEREERRVATTRTAWESFIDMIPWRRALAPASGLALALFLVFGSLKFYDLSAFEKYPRHLAQVENPSEEVGAFSFRSQSENVFVIWLYERSPEVRTDTALLNDMVLQ